MAAEPAVVTVAIHNLACHGEGGKPGIGEWGLWIRSFERWKLLGLLPRRIAVEVPSALIIAIHAVKTGHSP